MLHPQGRAFKGGGGNPTAFPQKKRCNLKKRTPPIFTGTFLAKGCRCKGGQAKGAHWRGRLQAAAAGVVEHICGGVLIFQSRRLRFFFTCHLIKRKLPPHPV